MTQTSSGGSASPPDDDFMERLGSVLQGAITQAITAAVSASRPSSEVPAPTATPAEERPDESDLAYRRIGYAAGRGRDPDSSFASLSARWDAENRRIELPGLPEEVTSVELRSGERTEVLDVVRPADSGHPHVKPTQIRSGVVDSVTARTAGGRSVPLLTPLRIGTPSTSEPAPDDGAADRATSGPTRKRAPARQQSTPRKRASARKAVEADPSSTADGKSGA